MNSWVNNIIPSVREMAIADHATPIWEKSDKEQKPKPVISASSSDRPVSPEQYQLAQTVLEEAK